MAISSRLASSFETVSVGGRRGFSRGGEREERRVRGGRFPFSSVEANVFNVEFFVVFSVPLRVVSNARRIAQTLSLARTESARGPRVVFGSKAARFEQEDAPVRPTSERRNAPAVLDSRGVGALAGRRSPGRDAGLGVGERGREVGEVDPVRRGRHVFGGERASARGRKKRFQFRFFGEDYVKRTERRRFFFFFFTRLSPSLSLNVSLPATGCRTRQGTRKKQETTLFSL